MLAGKYPLALDQPQVMGVINVTPDSFYDGGRLSNVNEVLWQAKAMVEAGARILDVGGESTRPGAEPITIDQELDRVMPVIERLLAETDVMISVDTRHVEVMQAAIDAGVHMVNDVNALREPGALELMSKTDVAICLMHMRGEPKSMQIAPQYSAAGVVADVLGFLQTRVKCSMDAGIAKERLIIDPGFGFGKCLADNLALLKGLKAFVAEGLPLLVGVSRKSMFQQLLNLPIEERMTASIAAAIWAVQQGANIIRTHDVKQTVEAFKVFAALA